MQVLYDGIGVVQVPYRVIKLKKMSGAEIRKLKEQAWVRRAMQDCPLDVAVLVISLDGRNMLGCCSADKAWVFNRETGRWEEILLPDPEMYRAYYRFASHINNVYLKAERWTWRSVYRSVV